CATRGYFRGTRSSVGRRGDRHDRRSHLQPARTIAQGRAAGENWRRACDSAAGVAQAGRGSPARTSAGRGGGGMIWLLVALCLAVSFVFSGIEAGILSVNRVRLAHQVRQREAAALVLERLLGHPERLMITVLIVTNLANIFALVLVADWLVAHLGQRGYLVAL